MQRFVLVVCMAVGFGACGGKPPPASSESKMKDPAWLPFTGRAEPAGDTVVLTAANGDAFEMAAPDVRIEGSTISVRDRANTKSVSKPPAALELSSKSGEPSALVCGPPCNEQDDCPSKCAACIGLVRVCCGGGGTRGVCLGVVSCPGGC